MIGPNGQQPGDTLLKLEDVHMYFGKVAALAGVSLDVKKGEIHSIIGPNGAGKTVMMNCINGLYKPQQGAIYYGGEQINHYSPPHARQTGHLAHLSENRTLRRHDRSG